MTLKQVNPWYQEGLHFECTGCGGCCTGAPGYIWVTEEEIANLAAHLKLNIDEFSKKYVRRAQGKYSLKETKPNNDCVFLEGKRCTVYEFRPVQCRTFPFWTQLLTSKEEWEEAAKSCEGIKLQKDPSTHIPFEEIEKRRQMTTVV